MSRDDLLSPHRLAEAVSDARERSFELVADLTDEQWMGPRLAIVNPLRWEIGHVAWFQEKWVLRHAGGRPPLRADADALYDSAAVPHDTRWALPLPSRAETLAYARAVRDRVLERIRQANLTEAEVYFIRLAVLHEDMHTEAFTYTRQTLGYPAPRLFEAGAQWHDIGALKKLGGGPLPGDVPIPGGTFMLGATPEEPFIFDNEKWVHPVEVKPYAIARAAVSQAEFARFVEDGGYQRRACWSEEGWRWREAAGAAHPVYWRREASGWSRREFDRWVPLEPHCPALHVNWYEAEAYCRWAGRRLPSEAEWEMAASWDPHTGRKRRYPWGDEPPTPECANLEWRWADPGVETPVGTDEIRSPTCGGYPGSNQSPTYDGGFGTDRPGFQPRGCGTLDVGALPAGDSASGCRQMIGNVWEWTSSDFAPYPGFVVDPYKEYSEPWFYTHKVLRGGCWTTRARLIRNTWRNFYRPDRRDVWAGFRTCAL